MSSDKSKTKILSLLNFHSIVILLLFCRVCTQSRSDELINKAWWWWWRRPEFSDQVQSFSKMYLSFTDLVRKILLQLARSQPRPNGKIKNETKFVRIRREGSKLRVRHWRRCTDTAARNVLDIKWRDWPYNSCRSPSESSTNGACWYSTCLRALGLWTHHETYGTDVNFRHPSWSWSSPRSSSNCAATWVVQRTSRKLGERGYSVAAFRA